MVVLTAFMALEKRGRRRGLWLKRGAATALVIWGVVLAFIYLGSRWTESAGLSTCRVDYSSRTVQAISLVFPCSKINSKSKVFYYLHVKNGIPSRSGEIIAAPPTPK